MKQLKFSEPLPKLILEGEKDTTWRINDKQSIEFGDALSLCYNDGEEFAKAKVVSTRLTTFGELTAHDKEGHEKFSSDEEMYKKYSDYYKQDVTSKTSVKVIKFKTL
ncbi:MAG: ASCH domain-containing protein [Candidatus Woesearchaeota archaeon]|jgi:hypothetical protein|nr:ASCH domain-containing protein [Candidatus Woesearchaeota archaeon]|tara:strand:- start:58 stop:378 length:321 start_codon:yes stop_codon:yes gene_type:complete